MSNWSCRKYGHGVNLASAKSYILQILTADRLVGKFWVRIESSIQLFKVDNSDSFLFPVLIENV